MSTQKLEAGYELYNIYATLRKLKSVNLAKQNAISRNNNSILDVSVFSREFLLKLLEGRLSELDAFCKDLVLGLFKRLKHKNKKLFGDESPLRIRNTQIQATQCRELDEYFHYSLYYLYDFLLELDWHENLVDLVQDDTNYHARSKLVLLQNFSHFQKLLTEHSVDQKADPNKPSTSPKEVSRSLPSKSLKSIKSTLSSTSSRLGSPSRRRRVRFQDSSLRREPKTPEIMNREQDLADSHSILALDLLLFALNLFTQSLYNNLLDWQSKGSDLITSLTFVGDSKQKIRTSQLQSISRQIKTSNDIYLTILEHLADVRKIYLNNCVLGIICSRDVGRELLIYKTGRIDSLIRLITLDVERKVITNFAEQCLQILFDLIVSEINLPPVELNASTRHKNKVELSKSRDNYLNFITSWMNVDDIVFGFVAPKKRSSRTGTSSGVDEARHTNEPSTLATGGAAGQFKSSSRILAQMDNLHELMRDLLVQVCDRIRSHKQMRYFLELVHTGLDLSFDMMAETFGSQFAVAKEANLSVAPASVAQNLEAINKTVDMIAFKVRSLKFIHVFSSIDRLIKEVASSNKIEFHARQQLEKKLEEFTERCTQQTGSTYKS